MSSTSNAYAGGVALICVWVALWLGFLGLLWRWNKYGKKKEKEEEMECPNWKSPKEIVTFFFNHLLLDFVIGPIYTVLNIRQFAPGNTNWTINNGLKLKVQPLFHAFVIFSVFKYAYLIAELLLELKYHKLRDRLEAYFRRPDFLEIIAIILFVPLIIIDGLCINAAHAVGQNGNIFHYDEIVLVVIDGVIFFKTVLMMVLRNDSRDGRYQYDLLNVTYTMLAYVYMLFLIFCFVLLQLGTLPIHGMSLTSDEVLILVSLLTHPIVCGYTSMVRQSIISNDKAFRKNPTLRLRQIQAYIYFFREQPLWQLLNLGVYAYAYYQYIVIYFLIPTISPNLETDVVLRAGITAVKISTYCIDIFYLINLVYGTCKRIGCYLGLKYPFDCSTYAQAMNTVLSECNTTIRVNTHMQT